MGVKEIVASIPGVRNVLGVKKAYGKYKDAEKAHGTDQPDKKVDYDDPIAVRDAGAPPATRWALPSVPRCPLVPVRPPARRYSTRSRSATRSARSSSPAPMVPTSRA